MSRPESERALLARGEDRSVPASNPTIPPNALQRWNDIVAEITGKKVALFLDFDGTLAAIVSHPDHATLSGEMRQTLTRIAERCPTTIVSGRARSNIEDLIGLAGIGYAGSHGFDINGPPHCPVSLQIAADLAPMLRMVAEELRHEIQDVPGVLVEDKILSVALHYRRAPEPSLPFLRTSYQHVLARYPKLRGTFGKSVLEIRPDVDWDKGRAVLWLLEQMQLDDERTVAIYIGDDMTDEDAFRVLTRGIGVLVTDVARVTAARYSLHSVDEAEQFLSRLCELVE